MECNQGLDCFGFPKSPSCQILALHPGGGGLWGCCTPLPGQAYSGEISSRTASLHSTFPSSFSEYSGGFLTDFSKRVYSKIASVHFSGKGDSLFRPQKNHSLVFPVCSFTQAGGPVYSPSFCVRFHSTVISRHGHHQNHLRSL